MKYVADGKVLDGAGISSFDTLDEAKGIWCFWLSVYELEDTQWEKFKADCSSYEDASKYLKENFIPVHTKS